MSDAAARIAENLQRVRDAMHEAAVAANRAPDDVRLVAVAKYVGVAATAALLEAGCQELAESRPQQLWEKAAMPELEGARWHLVGHLQRNKVQRTLPLVELIHSVDSDRLLAAIDAAAANLDGRARVLLEVNCSGDATKHGLTPAGLRRLTEDLVRYENVEVAGLMTMAARTGGAEVARRNFADLRALREQFAASIGPELSMGMSGDFREAIAEGATLVRIGSVLFEGVQG